MDLSATLQAMFRRPFFQNIAYTSCWDDPKPLRSYFVRLRVFTLQSETEVLKTHFQPASLVLSFPFPDILLVLYL